MSGVLDGLRRICEEGIRIEDGRGEFEVSLMSKVAIEMSIMGFK
jgi:hypothetical protein